MAVTNPTSIVATQNVAKRWRFTFLNASSVPINVTGFTFSGYYMTKRGKDPLGTFTYEPSLSNLTLGEVVFSLADGWTDADNVSVTKPERLFEFEVNVTDPANAGLIIYGYFTILRSSV